MLPAYLQQFFLGKNIFRRIFNIVFIIAMMVMERKVQPK